jgi:hypothetical protein
VTGRLTPGDELSIAHLRYRLEDDGDLPAFISVPEPPRGRTAARTWDRPRWDPPNRPCDPPWDTTALWTRFRRDPENLRP